MPLCVCAGVENQISYRLHLGRERIYTRIQERGKRKSNKMESSRREPTLTPFLCCSVFCGGRRDRFSSEPMTKAFRPSSNDFSSLSLPPLFLRPGRHTHKTPAATDFIYNQRNNNGRPKMRIKTRASCVYFLVLSFTARLVASSTTTAAAATQPMNYGESVRGRKERITVAQ